MKVLHLLYVVLATILIAALAYVSVLHPVIPLVGAATLVALAAGIYLSPKISWLGRIFLPQVFVSDDLTSYGLRERPTILRYLASIVTIIDGVTCGVLYQITGKEYRWLIQPTRITVNTRSADEWTDPGRPEYRQTDGTDSFPHSYWKRMYLTERAALTADLIKRAGWRAAFYTGICELPKTHPKNFRVDTEFILF